MDSNKDLERVIQDKVKPIIDTSMQKFLGISIKELSADISDRLKRTPLLDFKIDTSVPFKKAKQLFKEEYIKKLLQLKQGNISDVAKLANIDRRSIHRFAKNLKKELRVHKRNNSQIHHRRNIRPI